MTTDYEELARATIQVQAEDASGSGFLFLRSDLALTNQHVVEGASEVFVLHGGADRPIAARVLSSSPADEDDFAVLQLSQPPSGEHAVLHPADDAELPRGTEVLIAGFPHGISDLLVQRGIISGPLENYGFYLDVPVNEGNSGGPVIDANTGLLLGIVTASRFLGGEQLDDLYEEAQNLATAAAATSQIGTMQLMGVDFGAFAAMTGRSLGLLQRVIAANANTGLGIAYKIAFAHAETVRLGFS